MRILFHDGGLMANKSDLTRDGWMLTGPLKNKGYDWWWHSFTGVNEKTKERKTFYVEFFTCNPGLSKEEAVIVWNDPVKQQKGIKPSYLMVNVGYWGKEHAQIHRFFPFKEVSIKKDAPFSIEAKDCSLSETYTKGSVSVTKEDIQQHPEWMCDAGEMEWNLKIDKKIAFHVGYGASKLFRVLNSFEMFWHAEGMKTEYSGEVVLNGEKYIVDPNNSNGYADKNWGGDFTSPWVWLSSNDLTSEKTGEKLENSVFDIGGGCPKIYRFALKKKLLGELYYEGKDYEFNFSKFWTGSKTTFECQETDQEIVWNIKQTTFFTELDTEVTCKKEEMLLINYESPDGHKRHTRLWNGGTGVGTLKLYRKGLFGKKTLIDTIHAKGIGCEFGEYPK